MLTPHQARYLAFELTRRHPSDSYEKFTETLSNAQVDLNPHQIEAAYFAFQSPLSKGALLADEVGLGKTIEAGILLSQKWAERKRKLLIIVPSNLRKQWSQELQDKFFIPSIIMEKSSFNAEIQKRNLNPFQQNDLVLICSYHYARNSAPYIQSINWDLIIVDEAHRLRNVYKPQSKIANIIKEVIEPHPKVLLTATPLQNSLLELYGLVSIIDEYSFGDLKSFKQQYSKFDPDTGNFEELKERLRPICHRTLRSQVQEYVNYTSRQALVQEFIPQPDEQELYNRITDFLRSERLYSLPVSQRHLLTLILLKLQASSSFAIAPTFLSLINRLEQLKKIIGQQNEFADPLVNLADEYENFDNQQEEWIDEEEESEENSTYTKKQFIPSEADLPAINQEIDTLRHMHELATRIDRNSKGDNLLIALQRGFEEMAKKGGNRKAIIFTESTRTQRYLQELLEKTEYKGETVLFNGTNSDPQSNQIYQQWLKQHAQTDRITGSKTADKRAAIVEYFRDHASILIATEAAAEGINLQFCSLIVNYDMPWNPQRIEQRIGRCHRYLQKNDVVVVNFLNRNNAADVRVYELLDQKFKLFSGVFGASDEVLGSIESGVDLERRIATIYQSCRTEAEIQLAFDELQAQLEPQINNRMQQARQTLLENFDDEVHQKLRLSLDRNTSYTTRLEKRLWDITCFALQNLATFNHEQHSFLLHQNPYPELKIDGGPYRLAKQVEDAHQYRIGHPLAQQLLHGLRSSEVPIAQFRFQCTGTRPRVSALENYAGCTGWLQVTQLTIEALEAEDHLLMAACLEDGTMLDTDLCEKMLSLPAQVEHEEIPPPASTLQEQLSHLLAEQKRLVMAQSEQRNGGYFDAEMTKLEKWADDRKNSLEWQIKDLDKQIRLHKNEQRHIQLLADKVKAQRHIKELEKKRAELRQSYFTAQDEIDQRKENLLSNMEQKLAQKIHHIPIIQIKFTIT